MKVVGWCISNKRGGVIHLQQKRWGGASITKVEGGATPMNVKGWCMSNEIMILHVGLILSVSTSYSMKGILIP